MESDALKAAEREERVTSVEDLMVDELDDKPAETLLDSLDDDTIGQLKDLIKQWDSLNLPL